MGEEEGLQGGGSLKGIYVCIGRDWVPAWPSGASAGLPACQLEDDRIGHRPSIGCPGKFSTVACGMKGKVAASTGAVIFGMDATTGFAFLTRVNRLYHWDWPAP